jgi:hypothetical protein
MTNKEVTRYKKRGITADDILLLPPLGSSVINFTNVPFHPVSAMAVESQASRPQGKAPVPLTDREIINGKKVLAVAGRYLSRALTMLQCSQTGTEFSLSCHTALRTGPKHLESKANPQIHL